MSGALISEQKAADARTAVLGIALLADAAALVALRGIADGSVVRAYAAAHLALLSLDLVLTRVAITRHELQERARALAVAIEIAVLLAWLHAAGSTSTPLLALSPALVAAYRVAHGRRMSAVATAGLVLGKLALFVAESAGVVPIAPLFGEGTQHAPVVLRAGGLLLGLCADAAACAVATSFASATIVAHARPTGARASDREARSERMTPSTPIDSPIDSAAPAAPSAGLVGRTIAGAYEIHSLVARGGMGDVYRASRAGDLPDVALKVLHAHLATDPAMIARFRNEVRAVRELPTDRIAPVHEVGEEGGMHYLVMDLLDGEDLATVLRREQTLSRRDVELLADHLSEACDAAHAAGVIHRDVKPGNIIVARDEAGLPSFRLLDFGIARLLDDAGGSRVALTAGLLGSPGYLAPEQVSDRFGQVGPRTDVFGVGSVLYRALTGAPAFPSRQAAAAIHEATSLHPPPPSTRRNDLPLDVDLVVALALAKNPDDRYASVSELARDLRLAFESALPEERRARARTIISRAPAPSATITSAA